MKWGDLYTNMRGWVFIHKLGMWGFAMAAAVGLFLPILGKRTYASVTGGALLGFGSAYTAMVTMVHATQASSIGAAWINTPNGERKAIYRAVGEAFMAYDIGVTAGASIMISAGIFLIAYAMWRRGVVSALPAIIIAGLGFTWTAQFHHVFNYLGFSVPEAIHWAAFGVAMIAIGAFTHLEHRRAIAAPVEE